MPQVRSRRNMKVFELKQPSDLTSSPDYLSRPTILHSTTRNGEIDVKTEHPPFTPISSFLTISLLIRTLLLSRNPIAASIAGCCLLSRRRSYCRRYLHCTPRPPLFVDASSDLVVTLLVLFGSLECLQCSCAFDVTLIG
ncbi:hypothetical protein PIB30_045104 [Stylosanthes scabra]|uniref:Uncharacterized protein n=1 Tax=Stylosanthes scabra TaxID=79078 RepID=A0ABU6ZET6_9FABA|nr:hypothetical protein [Stylosanthes scabra]